jgi:endoribonuclease LACTB2
MTSAAGRAVRIGVSVYVVRGTMIDSGFHRERDTVLEARAQLRVGGVIVTHWHEDHAGNVATLARHGVPIAMRAETEAMLRHAPELPLYRRLVWGRPPALDNFERFEAEGLEFLHTPGHSSDHQVVWDTKTGTVFSGDLWLGVRARVLHSAEDPYRIVESLRQIAALGPTRMFDAHRGLVREPVRALIAKAEWVAETIGEIERRIGKGHTDREILAGVLGGEEFAGYISYGDYARRNFVSAVRRRLSSSD